MLKLRDFKDVEIDTDDEKGIVVKKEHPGFFKYEKVILTYNEISKYWEISLIHLGGSFIYHMIGDNKTNLMAKAKRHILSEQKESN